ncbi:MAG: DNA repair protein RadA [Candidatus Nanopelagicales bacterium]|jgi:DNA repair protein RadA/Sms|nr:DNA repair protein RadA [Candidatus Nanopelagicales bacterium]
MAKATRPTYKCTECGWTGHKWVGRCPECQAWSSVTESSSGASSAGLRTSTTGVAPGKPARPVKDIPLDEVERTSTGIEEFDRVLGGGLVAGQCVLLAGEPGVGKSTLLLEAADKFARAGAKPRKVLYISGEESAEQIGIRARRIGVNAQTLLIADETDLAVLLGHVEDVDPDLLIVDSVQTIASAELDGRAGGVAQVHEVTQVLTRAAKGRRMPLLLIGQSTRDNSVAGPRSLEHLVDTVLTFEGDRGTPLRLLRANKNRYGPADEVACFEQADDGLRQVTDPSALFRSQREQAIPGTCIAITLEGRRALLVEVQALTTTSPGNNPMRRTTGFDNARAAMLIAVTERAARLKLWDKDVYLATVAGAKISDPGADLAMCLAITSSARDKALPIDLVAIGEVALSGDVRPVPGMNQRLSEAARIGFKTALVPKSTKLPPGVKGIRLIEVSSLGDAVNAV